MIPLTLIFSIFKGIKSLMNFDRLIALAGVIVAIASFLFYLGEKKKSENLTRERDMSNLNFSVLQDIHHKKIDENGKIIITTTVIGMHSEKDLIKAIFTNPEFSAVKDLLKAQGGDMKKLENLITAKFGTEVTVVGKSDLKDSAGVKTAYFDYSKDNDPYLEGYQITQTFYDSTTNKEVQTIVNKLLLPDTASIIIYQGKKKNQVKFLGLKLWRTGERENKADYRNVNPYTKVNSFQSIKVIKQ